MSQVFSDKLSFFLASLENTPWLTQVGQPTAEDENLIRIDYNFVLNHNAGLIEQSDGNEYEYWGDLLAKAEMKFERIIFDNDLLDEQTAINSFIDKLKTDFKDKFYDDLLDEFESYYGDTYTYAHELINPYLIKRFIRGTAFEILVSEIDSSLTFFQNLMPWLKRGHWTYGWQGEFPQGKLILW